MNSKRSIVFRADGNSEIGLGHVMRCIALCEMLKDFFVLKFAIQNPSASIQDMLAASVSQVIALPQTADYNEDAGNFMSILSKDDLVVLDGYYFDAHYQKRMKEACDKLIYIDDLVSGHQYADVIINHNGLVKADDYDSKKNTTFLLGTHYALVRKKFFDAKMHGTTTLNIEKPISVLINLGGADPENVSLSILTALLSEKDRYSITLIIGAANKNMDSFIPFNSVANVRIKRGLSADEMIEEISKCSIAIVSCSTIAYEVSILNKPFIGILTASNQQSNAIFFEKNALAVSVLDTHFNAADVLKSVEPNEEKWNKSLQNQRLFFDSKTIERFQHAFLSMNPVQIIYRKALETDLMTYFNWANDESTRKNSFNSDRIDLKGHTGWFLQKIASPDSLLLIFETKEKTPVGQVRIETGADNAVIGISIDAAFRGQSLASFMIDSACTEYFRNFTQTTIAAHIKAANIASIKSFEKAGFNSKEEYMVGDERRIILFKQNV